MEWTNDEIGRMKIMREEGLTAKTIAEKLGRSISSVRGKISDLGMQMVYIDKQCERCGKMLYRVPMSKKYCAACREETDRLNKEQFYLTHTVECICARCGKTFRSKYEKKYCSQSCISAARKEEVRKRKGVIPKRGGRIDIEIYSLGKLLERRENVPFREARAIYKKGWTSEQYCTAVYVDGVKINTQPAAFKFFDFRGEEF